MKAKSLKLNALAADELKQKEMESVTGGLTCGCGCIYEGTSGGSGRFTNALANKSHGYMSTYNIYQYDPINGWRPVRPFDPEYFTKPIDNNNPAIKH